MKVKTLALLTAALAAYPYVKRMRSQAAGSGDRNSLGLVTDGRYNPQGRIDESDLDYETPQAGYDESPNTAQRLRDADMLGSPVSGTNGSEELFKSSSQRSEEPVAPGIPDLTRGA
jgi:hypothetical protein